MHFPATLEYEGIKVGEYCLYKVLVVLATQAALKVIDVIGYQTKL